MSRINKVALSKVSLHGSSSSPSWKMCTTLRYSLERISHRLVFQQQNEIPTKTKWKSGKILSRQPEINEQFSRVPFSLVKRIDQWSHDNSNKFLTVKINEKLIHRNKREKRPNRGIYRNNLVDRESVGWKKGNVQRNVTFLFPERNEKVFKRWEGRTPARRTG